MHRLLYVTVADATRFPAPEDPLDRIRHSRVRQCLSVLRKRQREKGTGNFSAAHKLTAGETEALRSHVQTLFTRALLETQGGNTYAGVSSGHWVKKNVNSGTFMIFEDGSFWNIDTIDNIDAMLWLPVSEITVLNSRHSSPGYNYLIVNTDDGEQAHAKYMGHE